MSAEAARRTVRILTWAGLATGVLGGLLIAFPKALPFGGPWVQLALGIVTLILAFRARKAGIADIPDFDGRMSLLAALLGFGVVFFASQAAYSLIAAAA